MTRRRVPAWAKGGDVRVHSPARLDLAMIEKGCNNSELARVAGMKGPSYVSKMRRGVPGNRSIDPIKAERIAKYLGVDLFWLFIVPGNLNSDEVRAA